MEDSSSESSSSLYVNILHSDFSKSQALHELSNFHTHLACACLTSAYAQLAVIKNSYETPSTDEQNFDPLPALLKERFDPHFYHSDGIYLRSTGEPYAEGVQRLLFDQLRADKQYIMHTLRTVKHDLHQNRGGYESLEQTVTALLQHQQDEEQFVLEYAQNVLMLRRLRNYETEQKRLQIASPDVVKMPLLDQTIIWNAMRLRFTQHWENARQDQQQQRCRATEIVYRTQMAATQQSIDYEIRCKLEVEMFMTNKIELMNQDCVKWMEKFDADYETAEVDIQVAIEQLDELNKKREDAQAQFEHRKFVIDEFYRKRREKEEFERRLVMFTKNALVLQIWARAFMVRNNLGPYKRKKPKKQKKK